MAIDPEISTTDVLAAGERVDIAAARRWAATFRLVHRVEFTSPARGADAVIHGVGHRLPISRCVPRHVALGLVHLGCPATVRQRGA